MKGNLIRHWLSNYKIHSTTSLSYGYKNLQSTYIQTCQTLLFILFTCFILNSCASECDKGSVLAQIEIVDSKSQKPFMLTDTLTITNPSGKIVLLNRITKVTHISLPLKYNANKDTLQIRFSSQDGRVGFYSVCIEHHRRTHFESTDCPFVIFHHIEKVSKKELGGTLPLKIDSIHIISSNVDYDQDPNLRFYCSTTDHE